MQILRNENSENSKKKKQQQLNVHYVPCILPCASIIHRRPTNSSIFLSQTNAEISNNSGENDNFKIRVFAVLYQNDCIFETTTTVQYNTRRNRFHEKLAEARAEYNIVL